MTLEDSIQGFRLRVLTDATRSGNGHVRTVWRLAHVVLSVAGPPGTLWARRVASEAAAGPAGPAQPGVGSGRAPGRREGAGVADARPPVGERPARTRWRVGGPGHGVAGQDPVL